MENKIALELADILKKSYDKTGSKLNHASDGVHCAILKNQCTIMLALRCIVVDLGNLAEEE